MKKRRNILLALGWKDHRLLQGIGRYSADSNWHIASESVTHDFNVPWGWEGDGVVAWLSENEELADFVEGLGVPTVDFSLRRRHLPFAHVSQDHAACARLAAEHLFEKGIRRFMCHCDTENWVQAERWNGFVQAVRELGCGDPELVPVGRGGDWEVRRSSLAEALLGHSDRVGVFAANGTLAIEVYDACRSAMIMVPDEVSIVGVEDDMLLSQSVFYPITAVDPNYEELGYQGSACLDRLLRGNAVSPEVARVAPAGIVVRASTDVGAVEHPILSEALEYIRANLSKGISVDSVATACGVSRRNLHQVFKDYLGVTPGEYLRSERIGLSQKLLTDTDLNMGEIAKKSGFFCASGFFVAFRRTCEMTPGEYRSNTRP